MTTNEDQAETRDRAPITLGTLREAWENAEVPTDDAPIREGDVVIQRVSRDHFHVFHETHNWVAAPDCADVRILSRAPEPEPEPEPWDAVEALRAVLDLHKPLGNKYSQWCETCSESGAPYDALPYPCPTVRALTPKGDK